MIIAYLLCGVLLVVFCLLLLAAFSYRQLPSPLQARTQTLTLPPNPDGVLSSHILKANAQNPNLTGIYGFGSGQDAFAARISLVEAAEYSLDIRYYIWKNDISGRLMIQRLYAAAERGVRVRILLDDNTMAGMDGVLLALDKHPNIEVRLFNPFMQRRFRLLGFLSDFKRLNYRMHNKSFTADSVVSIIGGRNIGDEYFGAGDGIMFADMDVAVIGDVMNALNDDFDQYWASDIVYPASTIIPSSTKPITIQTTPLEDDATQTYIKQVRQSDYVHKLALNEVEFLWAKVTLISDNPIRSQECQDDTVTTKIVGYFEKAKHSLNIVSPYFVPTKSGQKLLVDIAKSGTSIHILTNSLAANDVAAVHSGYAKYRKPLLKAGIKLFELKPDAAPITQKKKQGLASVYRGGSGSSLHAKTFTVDGRYMFVGSYNLDPRSAIHNTEMGIIIDSPQMAQAANEHILNNLHHTTYHLELSDHRVKWHSITNHDEPDTDQKIITYHKDPAAPWHKRVGVWLLKWLPIEWLL